MGETPKGEVVGVVQLESRHLSLGCHAASVGQARRFAASFARECEVDGLTEDLELVTSELVSNAIRHADGSVVVAFVCVDGRVRVEVSDDGRGVPRLLAPEPSAESGRGLVIVAGVADNWGSTPAAGSGKTVWAELSPQP